MCLYVDGAGDTEKTDRPVDDAQVRLMPEYLVVCAWRSIKEMSLLLGQLTSTAPVIDPSEVNDPNIEVEDVTGQVAEVVEFGICTSGRNDGLLTVQLVSSLCAVRDSRMCCVLCDRIPQVLHRPHWL